MLIKWTTKSDLHYFRLVPRCNLDLRSSRMLRNVEWWFANDVSGQPLGPIFNWIVVPETSVTTVLRWVNSWKCVDI